MIGILIFTHGLKLNYCPHLLLRSSNVHIVSWRRPFAAHNFYEMSSKREPSSHDHLSCLGERIMRSCLYCTRKFSCVHARSLLVCTRKVSICVYTQGLYLRVQAARLVSKCTPANSGVYLISTHGAPLTSHAHSCRRVAFYLCEVLVPCAYMI